jgi:four helix bundle protein
LTIYEREILNRHEPGGNVDQEQFRARTKGLAVRVIRLANALPDNRAAATIGGQLLRAATSIGADYRAACRARSTADMIAKLKIVEEEADKTLYWLEMLVEAEIMSVAKLAPLMTETDEILAMTVASIKTLRTRR